MHVKSRVSSVSEAGHHAKFPTSASAVHAAHYPFPLARAHSFAPAAPTQAGRRPLLSASPYRPAARPGREDHARGAAAARHEPHGQARPMGEGSGTRGP